MRRIATLAIMTAVAATLSACALGKPTDFSGNGCVPGSSYAVGYNDERYANGLLSYSPSSRFCGAD